MGQKDATWAILCWLGIWLGLRALGYVCAWHPAKIDEALWMRWVRALAWHPLAGSLAWALIAWAVLGPRQKGDHARAPGEDSPSSPSHPLFQ